MVSTRVQSGVNGFRPSTVGVLAMGLWLGARSGHVLWPSVCPRSDVEPKAVDPARMKARDPLSRCRVGDPLSRETGERESIHLIFGAFRLDVRTLTFCQLMGLPLTTKRYSLLAGEQKATKISGTKQAEVPKAMCEEKGLLFVWASGSPHDVAFCGTPFGGKREEGPPILRPMLMRIFRRDVRRFALFLQLVLSDVDFSRMYQNGILVPKTKTCVTLAPLF